MAHAHVHHLSHSGHAPGSTSDCHGLHDAHGHHHGPANFGSAFAIGIGLNLSFVVIEAAAGLVYGSVALVADAGHNLSDVLALALAWVASIAARRPPSGRFTYGFKSSTILAAVANALLLAVAVGAILLETFHRLLAPQQPEGMVMVVVAGIGVGINALTAMLFLRGQEDLNIRGAYLHMAADALLSLGVVVAGVVIIFTGFTWIDPVVSLMIVAVIAWGTWGLARDSLAMGLHAVPARIDLTEVKNISSTAITARPCSRRSVMPPSLEKKPPMSSPITNGSWVRSAITSASAVRLLSLPVEPARPLPPPTPWLTTSAVSSRPVQSIRWPSNRMATTDSIPTSGPACR